MTIPDDLQQRLDAFMAASDCPGAVLGVLADDEVHVTVAGVLNTNTGVEVTPDSVFQIGSTTKIWTATQIMQLVDEGAVELDAPVRTYLPDFALTDEDAAAGMTIRHLLTHTSGMEGDVFDDVGTNDDCLELYVAAMSEQGTVHALGETWSYCNSGWVVLGRVIEVVTGKVWDQALKDSLGAPLGMTQLCTRPEEAILHRAAVGHIKPPGAEDFVVAPQWTLPRGLGPAGLITTSTGDLLAFARMHLEGGRAPDGTQVLSEASIRAMQEPQAECPEKHLLADWWGLGWMLNTWGGQRVIAHGGNTVGQSAYLFLVPDRGVAVSLLTNLTGGADAAKALISGLLEDLADAPMPPSPEPAAGSVELDLDRFVGTYRSVGVEMLVERNGDDLRALMAMSGPLMASLGIEEPIALPLHPMDPDGEDRTTFLTTMGFLGVEGWRPVTFYGDDGGRTRFLHNSGRVSRRVG